MSVLNELKPGLDEKLYERALVIELKGTWIYSRSTKAIPCSLKKSLYR